jgi:type I restriction-modification system DNA methylase subunit
MNGRVSEIAKTLRKASHKHTSVDVFKAFVDMAFCSMAKLTATTHKRAEELEAQYQRQADRFPVEYVPDIFSKAFAQLTMAYEAECEDFLGVLAGELGMLSAEMGQFFTPMHLCRLTAKITMGDATEKLNSKQRKFITLQEPAAGGGAMVLAAAAEFRDQGLDVGTSLWVEALELNYTTYQMCFLALSLSGVAGVVKHTNSLSREVFDVSITCNAQRFLYVHGNPFARPAPAVRVRKTPKPAPRVRVRKPA